eukprot:m.360504 g.360504  ORF g.360504 m.360504 type:complete len:346 (+) comp19071_c0_seq1:814-1851(+)
MSKVVKAKLLRPDSTVRKFKLPDNFDRFMEMCRLEEGQSVTFIDVDGDEVVLEYEEDYDGVIELAGCPEASVIDFKVSAPDSAASAPTPVPTPASSTSTVIQQPSPPPSETTTSSGYGRSISTGGDDSEDIKLEDFAAFQSSLESMGINSNRTTGSGSDTQASLAPPMVAGYEQWTYQTDAEPFVPSSVAGHGTPIGDSHPLQQQQPSWSDATTPPYDRGGSRFNTGLGPSPSYQSDSQSVMSLDTPAHQSRTVQQLLPSVKVGEPLRLSQKQVPPSVLLCSEHANECYSQQCSLKHKCKIGACSNRSPCRRMFYVSPACGCKASVQIMQEHFTQNPPEYYFPTL